MIKQGVLSSILSRRPVRWQLSLLIFIPLFVLFLFLSQLVLIYLEQLKALDDFEHRYAFYDASDSALNHWSDARESILAQRAETLQQNALETAKEGVSELGHDQGPEWQQALFSGFRDLDEFFLTDLEPEEWKELINEAFSSYLQQMARFEVASKEVNLNQLNHQFVLLRELQELVDQEYMEYVSSAVSALSPEHNRISNLALLQQQAIDAYLQRYATEQQVGILLEAFSHPSFEQATLLRDELAAGPLLITVSDLQTVQQRRTQITGVADRVKSQITSEIERISASLKTNILLNGFALVLGLFIALVFSMQVAKRFTQSLSFIGRSLEEIERTRDYSINLAIPGTDEFSSLSVKLAGLMKEREASERAILESKEEAEKANRAKSAFLANMSHEIRTPLNGILGMANILSKTKLEPSQRNHLSTVQSSSKVLLNLINDVLDLSKIESGGLNISPSESMLHSVFEDAASIITPRAHEANVSFEMDYALDIPEVLFFDEYRTAQIVLNLLSNAVKFSPDGKVMVSVFADRNYELSNEESYWDISVQVRDSGIGISPEQQKNIFTPFKQADDSITRRFQGTGLGLALSKNLAELMEGVITVESALGEGSTFTFRFPAKEVKQNGSSEILEGLTLVLQGEPGESLQLTESVLTAYGASLVASVDEAHDGVLYQASETDTNTDLPVALFGDETTERSAVLLFPAKNKLSPTTFPQHGVEHYFQLPVRGRKLAEFVKDAVRPSTEEEVEERAHNMKVLVIEDDKINQTVAEVTLQTEGFEVTLADNGEEGYKTFMAGDFDVVLMDCMMPVMDGFDSTRNIRAYEAEQGIDATPIIALTASVLNDDIDKCFEAGMDAYVHKPFEVNNLIGQIMRVTGKGEGNAV